MHTGFWWGNLRERDQVEDPGVDIKVVLQEWRWVAWIGLIWLGIGTGGGHL